MKKKKWFRLVTTILSICMVMALMPAMAFAGSVEDAEMLELYEAMEAEGAEIELLSEDNELSLLAVENVVWASDYPTLTEAVDAVETTGGIVVVTGQDNVLNDDLAIPSGVTVLLPYNDPATAEEISINGGDNLTKTHAYANSQSNGATSIISWPDDNLMHQLTVTKNGSITVEVGGMLILGGQFSSNNQGLGGQTYGTHSDIILEDGAEIIVKGILSTVGYITGAGAIQVVAGGQIFEPFVVTDYHGGTYTKDLYYADPPMCPFNSYAMLNIQCPMMLEYGAELYGYCNLYAGSQHNVTTARVIGEEDALLNLYDGFVEFTYDDSMSVAEHFDIGKTYLRVYGNADFGSLSLTIWIKIGSFSIPYTVSTNHVSFPMTYNFTYIQEEGELNVCNPVKILPGSEIWIKEESSLVLDKYTAMENKKEVEHIGALYVYDGYYSLPISGEMYPKGDELSDSGLPERGHLIVDGVLEIGAGTSFAGVVETTGNGTIIVDADATVGEAEVGEGYNTTKTTYVLTAKAPSYEKNGEYHLLEAGNTYYAVDDSVMVEESYTYNGSVTQPYGETQTITGTWTMLDLVMNKSKQHVEFRCGDKDFDGSVIIASYAGGKLQKTIVNNYDGCKEESISFAALVDEDTTIVRAFLLDGNYAPLSEVVDEEFTR